MTCHRLCNNSNTMDATIGAGTVYPYEASEITPFSVGFVLLTFYASCFFDHCVSFCTFLALGYLSFFKLLPLITLLVYSDFYLLII